MKTTLTLSAAVAGALVLSACASTMDGNTAPAPAGFDASASTFEGWARVANGEIRVYREQRDLTQAFAADCVSAVLPRNEQRAAANVNGSKIRLFGRSARWSDRSGGETHEWQGSTLVNECRRDVVFLADRVEVVR